MARAMDHPELRSGNRRMKLLRDCQRTALIAVTPNEQRGRRDRREYSGGVGVGQRRGHEPEANWVEVRHHGSHLGRELARSIEEEICGHPLGHHLAWGTGSVPVASREPHLDDLRRERAFPAWV